MALTAPRPSWTYLAWFGLAFLFVAWSDDEVPAAGAELRPSGIGRAAALGLAAGFAFHGVVLNWIYSTCLFAGTSRAVAFLAWSSLSLFLALNWALVGGLGVAATRGLPSWGQPWAWAVLWTAVTAATERWTPRLAADIFGYSQNGNLALLQISSFAGPHALGFLIIVWNAALAQAWLHVRRRPSVPFPAVTFALCSAALVASLVYGNVALAGRSSAQASGGPQAAGAGVPTVGVEILQPAVDQYRKWDAAFAHEIEAGFDALLSLPRSRPPALVLWPESALPEPVLEGSEAAFAARWARKLKAVQAVGAAYESDRGMHGSVLLIDPDGHTAGVYNKRRLVPFGEFVPFEFLRAYIGILNQLGGLTPGEAAQPLFASPLGPAAGSVCYEAMFPSLLRGDAARGARAIFNVTNDGWYKDTWGPYQHFEANVFRAIENRATVIRAANTGISGVIDPWGMVIGRLDLGRRGRLDVDVPASAAFPGGSFYARHGDWLGSLCILAAVFLILNAGLGVRVRGNDK